MITVAALAQRVAGIRRSMSPVEIAARIKKLEAAQSGKSGEQELDIYIFKAALEPLPKELESQI